MKKGIKIGITTCALALTFGVAMSSANLDVLKTNADGNSYQLIFSNEKNKVETNLNSGSKTFLNENGYGIEFVVNTLYKYSNGPFGIGYGGYLMNLDRINGITSFEMLINGAGECKYKTSVDGSNFSEEKVVNFVTASDNRKATVVLEQSANYICFLSTNEDSTLAFKNLTINYSCVAAE